MMATDVPLPITEEFCLRGRINRGVPDDQSQLRYGNSINRTQLNYTYVDDSVYQGT